MHLYQFKENPNLFQDSLLSVSDVVPWCTVNIIYCMERSILKLVHTVTQLYNCIKFNIKECLNYKIKKFQLKSKGYRGGIKKWTIYRGNMGHCT